MKLPIDNFELLGVGMGIDGPGVLRVLQRRTEKTPLAGFSEKTKRLRIEILQRASQALMDHRSGYISEDLITEIENPSESFEIYDEEIIAGLLLLLEADHAEECLCMAREIKKGRGYFDKDGTKNKELKLLMDYAALRASEAYKEKRYYEKADYILEMRLEEIAGDVKSHEMILQIERERKRLMPYKILDLISRDNNEFERREGIKLLVSLIEKRGGLDNESNEVMTQHEFRSFFYQIRQYLTVQEQIDIFRMLESEGSLIAAFLAGIALAASGFTQRKPERLREAISLLEKIERKELGQVISNMYLLLGNINLATEMFNNTAERELKDWCQEIASEPLGQMCAWCQEWLRRDVLYGYRDIDVEPDINAYFNDRDVVKFIENEDQKEDGRQMSLGRKKSGNRSLDQGLHNKYELEEGRIPRIENKKYFHTKSLGVPSKLFLGREKQVILVIIGCIVGSLALFAQIDSERHGVKEKKAEISSKEARSYGDNKLNTLRKTSEKKRIWESIEKWHKAKQSRLVGRDVPKEATNLISGERMLALEEEANNLQENGLKMIIDVKIKDIRVLEIKGDKAEVEANLEYEERIMDRKGKIISASPKKTYKRGYRLSKMDKGWVLD